MAFGEQGWLGVYSDTNPKLSSEMKTVSRGGAETELFRAGGGFPREVFANGAVWGGATGVVRE